MTSRREQLDALGYAVVGAGWAPPTVDPHPLCAPPATTRLRVAPEVPQRNPLVTSAVAIATALLAASLGLGATYLVRAARHEPVRPVLAPASGEHYGDAAGADDEVDVAPASP